MKKVYFPSLLLACCFLLYAFTAWPEKKEKVELNYQDFLALFEKKPYPIVVNYEKFETEKSRKTFQDELWKTIDGQWIKPVFAPFIPELKDGMFTREGPARFQSQALLAQTDNYDLLLYAVMPPWRSSEKWLLASYSKKGELLAELPIALNAEHEQLGAILSEDGSLMIQQWKIEIEKGVLQYKEVDFKRFIVQEDGRFRQTFGEPYPKK